MHCAEHVSEILIWARVDRLREFNADILIPHHGHPVEGADKISKLLTDYRDAIQFVHDQTLRYMNKGYTPDEIKVVTMPARETTHGSASSMARKHSIPPFALGILGGMRAILSRLTPRRGLKKPNATWT